MSAFIVKATRRIHALAVGLHLAGLRTAIQAAHKAADGVVADSKRAKSVRDAAENEFTKARLREAVAKNHVTIVTAGAKAEADKIGGTL